MTAIIVAPAPSEEGVISAEGVALESPAVIAVPNLSAGTTWNMPTSSPASPTQQQGAGVAVPVVEPAKSVTPTAAM